jgi:hypothetical protein
MKLYALHFATAAEQEGEVDDPSAKEMNLDDFAAPQVVHLAHEGSLSRKLDAVKEFAIESVREELEGSDEEMPEFFWTTMGWQKPERGREHEVWRLHTRPGHDWVASVVVQLVEDEEEGMA